MDIRSTFLNTPAYQMLVEALVSEIARFHTIDTTHSRHSLDTAPLGMIRDFTNSDQVFAISSLHLSRFLKRCLHSFLECYFSTASIIIQSSLSHLHYLMRPLSQVGTGEASLFLYATWMSHRELGWTRRIYWMDPTEDSESNAQSYIICRIILRSGEIRIFLSIFPKFKSN